MKNKSLLAVVVIVFLFLFGCSGDENNPSNTEDLSIYAYKSDKELVESTVEKIIKPEIQNFVNNATDLQNAVENFVTSTSQTNLSEAKKQWLKVAKSWARCYVFNIGDVKEKYFNIRFASFPINTDNIENEITSTQSITPTYVAQMGTDIKGIYAIEYLLFNKSDVDIISDFSDENRKKILQYIVNELVENTALFQSDWNTYADKLISNDTAILNIDNSLNIVFNGLNNVIHYVWETKIAKSAGYGNNDYIILEKVQAPYSKETLAIIKQNVEMTKQMFFNDNAVTISDKIKFITKNDDLNNLIKIQYAVIENALDDINNPYYDAIQTDNDKVKVLYDALNRLEVIFLTDVRSTLSLIITGTDGDGD